MSDIRTNTMSEKLEIISALRGLTVFLNNNQKYINPTNLADIMNRAENLEQKVKKSFKEDEGLDAIIQPLEEETEKQIEFIKKLEKRLEVNSHEEPEDEYKGVVISDI